MTKIHAHTVKATLADLSISILYASMLKRSKKNLCYLSHSFQTCAEHLGPISFILYPFETSNNLWTPRGNLTLIILNPICIRKKKTEDGDVFHPEIWGPPVICWFIDLSNYYHYYGYKCHTITSITHPR